VYTPVPKELTNYISLTYPKMLKDIEMRRHVSIFLVEGNGLVGSVLGRQAAVGVSSPWWVTGGVEAK
jgi:hypothetical protein